MLLKHTANNHLVEILSLNDLFDPAHQTLVGRYNYGEEMPDPQWFAKSELVFPSGEALPRCWREPSAAAAIGETLTNAN